MADPCEKSIKELEEQYDKEKCMAAAILKAIHSKKERTEKAQQEVEYRLKKSTRQKRPSRNGSWRKPGRLKRLKRLGRPKQLLRRRPRRFGQPMRP
jgi:hypothetical protein